MNYDYTLHHDGIDYGIITGNDQIVFIKVGLGGSYLGYENKYLTMARQLHKRYGCSVIVSSNPHDGIDHSSKDRQMIEQYVLENQLCSSELFFFGHSNGGIKGLELANKAIKFKKIVLVNMPLMINFHKTKRYISSIPQTQIVAVYGEFDASYPYVPFLDGTAENVKVLTVSKADHNFKGMLNEFIDLSDMIFIDT